jgi:CubicO group peptidase (beta-lactamase class C family)
MVKIGQMILGGGQWDGKQLIPAEYIARAVSPLAVARGGAYRYGFFFWVDTVDFDGKQYACKAGRGAGGQYLFMFPELDLVAVITSHNKGMGRMLKEAPARLIRAFR